MIRSRLLFLALGFFGWHAPAFAVAREQASVAGLSCQVVLQQRSSFVGDEVVATVRTENDAWLETMSFPSDSGISGYFSHVREVRLFFSNRGAFTLTAVVRNPKGTTGLCRVVHTVY